jgi:hypothetical protein
MTTPIIIVLLLITILYVYSLYGIMPELPSKKQWNLYPLNMICYSILIVMILILTLIK